jgi:hypothetical protein
VRQAEREGSGPHVTLALGRLVVDVDLRTELEVLPE